MSVISCRNISKSFATGFFRKKKKLAVNNLNFHLEKNEVFGIVGPNGAGKSTLLKILMGFIRQDAGEALLFGIPAGSCASHEHVGYLPEHNCLYKQLTILEHLRFAAQTAGIQHDEAKKRISDILQTVDLAEAARIPIGHFSKGMGQRAALAYALLSEPEILILDEPMSGLDPLGRRLVIDILLQYRAKGTTILFCSHILSDVERICSRIGIMNKGRLVTVTTPGELEEFRIKKNNGWKMTPLEAFFLETVQPGYHP